MTWAAFLVAALSGLATAATPYSEYILTPRSRIVYPQSVYAITGNGTVDHPEGLTLDGAGQVTVFHGPSAVTYDFGKTIGGIVDFTVGDTNGTDERIGISFTESHIYISSNSSDMTAETQYDETLWFNVKAGGEYNTTKEQQRGAFRYLTVSHDRNGSTAVVTLKVNFTAMPHIANDKLGDYTGYFHCNDEQLNRVWYAGAYTNELCTIDSTTGNSLAGLNLSTPWGTIPWWYNVTIAAGPAALTDGAKRDRLVWPGDLSISAVSVAVATYDMVTIRDSLDSLFSLQTDEGALPYAGIGLPGPRQFSFTYHLHTLNCVDIYYKWTGDLDWVKGKWNAYKLALQYALSFVDDTHLAFVVDSFDWGRENASGRNSEANAILYMVLNQAMLLADDLGDTSLKQSWATSADQIKEAANSLLWVTADSLFRDNDNPSSLYPQDGNVFAVVSNMTQYADQNLAISEALRSRWGPYGAPAPENENGDSVSPFVSGFELQAHYLAGQAASAVKLMKFMWGDFMLDDPRMTNSTFIEGYTTKGVLHYRYPNDARVSFTHGWSTGPTSALTNYAAGLQVIKGGGTVWRVAPSLGGLTSVQAGFTTNEGSFSVDVSDSDSDGKLVIDFSTPPQTTGSLSIEMPEKGGVFVLVQKSTGGNRFPGSGAQRRLDPTTGPNQRYEVLDLPGGDYVATITRS